MAEGNAGAQKCDGGQNVNPLNDDLGGETMTTMMKMRRINENEKESEVEEKGLVKKDNGGRNLQDEENEEKGNVEEEVWIENESSKGVKNKGEEDRKKYTCSPFDKVVLEKWPRNLMDLDDWPPYPWSLEYLERQMLWTWDSNPYWDIELMQGSWAYEDDEEIIWEDDVWHLKDIKEVPMKPFKKIRDSK